MFDLSSKISPSSEPTEILHIVFLLRFFRSFIKSVYPYQNAGENEIILLKVGYKIDVFIDIRPPIDDPITILLVELNSTS